MSSPPVPVVSRLAAVTVGVPDPVASASFLKEGLGFGVAEDGGARLVACRPPYGRDAPQPALLLVPHERLELLDVRFDAPDIRRLSARLPAAASDGERTLRFRDPSGLPLSCGPAEEWAGDVAPSPLAPRRLGHVNLIAASPPEAAAFYSEVLGLRLSEQIGDDLYFLRIAGEHHNVGLRGGEEPGLHHLGFEVSGWEAYPPTLDRLAELGHQVEYGPGRHGPGRNIFLYLREPHSGLRIELFCDMVALEAGHEPKRWEAGDRLTKTLNRWGPLPPQSFLE